MKEYTGGVVELQIENKDFTSKSLIEKVTTTDYLLYTNLEEKLRT